MAERKVLNKYIPPDFDPDKLIESKKLLKKIEKRKNKNKNKNKKKLLNIRMMYPFTLKCNKCNSFTYVGTKFNSRVEKLKDENYLNIPIWKFYGKCQDCKNEIIFKTDPKNGDYLLISGGVRTYDAHKEQELADDFYRSNNNAGEEDKIKNTEKESYNALLELKRNEQLEELQNMNKRHIDKFNSINKALSHLYEKSENENNENKFYMNYLDSEDEKAFFNLLNKNRTFTEDANERINKDQGIISNTYKGENNNLVVEEEMEEEVDEETLKNDLIIKNEEKLQDINEIKKNEEFLKENVHNNLEETKKLNKKNKINNNNIIKFNKDDSEYNDSVNNNHNISNLKNNIFKKKNLETGYNFIIKKKENLSDIFNEYNSDNTDDLKN
ncbi:conserved protein, unknown function [Plasmodium gallinaceum]|uniref:CWC16 domain-containing protein n=1 Tax=Plasmodium gallinaceum TaxID=5849 RepID=A0A1J1GNZ5_PLAGA|nr:conserved protein, unknown function [Plasmodium gallinaceum]CRG94209.1 conserved protein, unknown function [Plasmodium gallinaceum]